MKRSTLRWLIPTATLILTLSIGAAAFAATNASQSTDTSGTTQQSTTGGTAPAGTDTPSTGSTDDRSADSDHGTPWSGQRDDETPLTGDDLSNATAAALAEVGSDATVVRAETDADGNGTYEVHMVKADGTPTTVCLDESFTVVSVADGAGGGKGGHGGQRGDETPLTGDELAKVQAAALAEVGSDATVMRAETDADGNARYEAHVQKADGTNVTVYVDENYQVVSVEEGGPSGDRMVDGQDGQRPGHRRDGARDGSTGSDSGTDNTDDTGSGSETTGSSVDSTAATTTI